MMMIQMMITMMIQMMMTMMMTMMIHMGGTRKERNSVCPESLWR